MISRIGVAREHRCPEDPKGADKHVALVPADVKRLIANGCSVAVEHGAGSRLDFYDQDYLDVGARLESRGEIYRDKDLLIRIKGPTEEAIGELREGSTLFCMAHLPMYPTRRSALQQQRVTVVAMEGVSDYPHTLEEHLLAPKCFAKRVFDATLKNLRPQERHVVVVGYSPATDGMLRYLGRKQLASLLVVPADVDFTLMQNWPSAAIVLSDQAGIPGSQALCSKVLETGQLVFDFADFDGVIDDAIARRMFPGGAMPEFGQRSIQCLHETGRSGAQFGLEARRDTCWEGQRGNFSEPGLVLGYGNVAMGAIDQCIRERTPVYVLGRFNTDKSRIERWLQSTSLVINGAFIPDELAGIEYVITNQHARDSLRSGTILIDLIGGSETDRSPVEPVETCTFLSDPMFELHGIKIASVFAWPNLYRAKETCERYSSQIADVLTQPKGLLGGLQHVHPGIKKAIVLGPFE